jgi:antitoxin component YwqK of YwqJK toxin-antitoxin module
LAFFFRKRWGWFLFNTLLAFSLVNNIIWNTNLLTSLVITTVGVGGVLVFFNTNAVLEFFQVRMKARAPLLIALVCGVIVFLNVFFKPDNDKTTVSRDYLGFRADTAYLGSLPYTGLMTNYYRGGQVEIRGQYIDGKKQGLWEEFYDNGQLGKVCSYRHGKADGNVTEYFFDGGIKTSGTMADGKKDGLFREFFSNGRKMKEELYSHGVLHGQYRTWVENGSPETQGYYRNGAKDSLWKSWIEGILFVQENYKNDKREGLTTYYNQLETIGEEGYYKNGLREGLWKEFDDSGKVVAEKLYVKGVLTAE